MSTVQKNFVSASDEAFDFMGRIDFSDKNAPRLFYAGSQISFGFTGSSIKILINNMRIYGDISIGYFLDGVQGKYDLAERTGDIEFSLDVPAGDRHTLTLFKRQDATHILTFKGVYINNGAELFSIKHSYDLRIEAYGDSVSAGAVVECIDYTASNDPIDHKCVYDNSFYSFIMQTARALNAEINNNSQGGIAVLDGTGYYHLPQPLGLISTWDKLCYIPEGGMSQWDFARFTPDIVIIAVGQNDNHLEGSADRTLKDAEWRKKWTDAYRSIVENLHEKYPDAKIILTTTILMHDSEWDDAIGEIADSYPYTCHNIFSRNGSATPGHPRIPEQDEMARELTDFIKKIL